MYEAPMAVTHGVRYDIQTWDWILASAPVCSELHRIGGAVGRLRSRVAGAARSRAATVRSAGVCESGREHGALRMPHASACAGDARKRLRRARGAAPGGGARAPANQSAPARHAHAWRDSMKVAPAPMKVVPRSFPNRGRGVQSADHGIAAGRSLGKMGVVHPRMGGAFIAIRA